MPLVDMLTRHKALGSVSLKHREERGMGEIEEPLPGLVAQEGQHAEASSWWILAVSFAVLWLLNLLEGQ